MDVELMAQFVHRMYPNHGKITALIDFTETLRRLRLNGEGKTSNSN